MRGLQMSDIFSAFRVVKAAKVSNEIKRVALIAQNSKDFSINELGFELIFTILENCSDAEAEQMIYNFLSNILEMPVDDLKVMDPFELFELMKELKNYINVEQAKSFFISLSKMMK